MRVAFVIYGDLDRTTGGHIYDRLVVEQLRELGDEVTVISLDAAADSLPDLTPFDVVVADELCFRELSSLFGGAPAGVRRVLLVHHLTAWEHPSGAERERLYELERAAIASADACVVTSRVTADRLFAEGLARRVTIAEPGADRMPRSLTGGQEPSGALIRLLFVGNILRRKRVLELCHAFARLPGASAELVLVGAELEPDYAAEVRAVAAAPDLRGRLHFYGPLPAKAVSEQLALADVLVLPSELEGYGMVLSEALWASVPVIAARVGAAEQLVNLTEAGLLYEPSDGGGLSASLATFVTDGALRKRLRQAAWRAADRLPRWRDTALALRAAFSA